MCRLAQLLLLYRLRSSVLWPHRRTSNLVVTTGVEPAYNAFVGRCLSPIEPRHYILCWVGAYATTHPIVKLYLATGVGFKPTLHHWKRSQSPLRLSVSPPGNYSSAHLSFTGSVREFTAAGSYSFIWRAPKDSNLDRMALEANMLPLQQTPFNFARYLRSIQATPRLSVANSAWPAAV